MCNLPSNWCTCQLHQILMHLFLLYQYREDVAFGFLMSGVSWNPVDQHFNRYCHYCWSKRGILLWLYILQCAWLVSILSSRPWWEFPREIFCAWENLLLVIPVSFLLLALLFHIQLLLSVPFRHIPDGQDTDELMVQAQNASCLCLIHTHTQVGEGKFQPQCVSELTFYHCNKRSRTMKPQLWFV